jgi:hypothetical protein
MQLRRPVLPRAEVAAVAAQALPPPLPWGAVGALLQVAVLQLPPSVPLPHTRLQVVAAAVQ